MTGYGTGLIYRRIFAGEGARVIGTYMDPLKTYASAPTDPDFYYRALGGPDPTPETVIVTAASGLYVQVPEAVAALDPATGGDAIARFRDEAARTINYLLCDLALAGQVSAAASPTQLGSGRVLDGVAVTLSAGGGRESYHRRALGPYPNEWHLGATTNPDIPRAAAARGLAQRLRAVSETLPEFVVGAYSSLSRHHAAEAVLDAFVVIEQLVDHLWREHLAAATQNGRRQRVENYQVAQRLEVLLSEGRLASDLYESIEQARSARNRVAHRGLIDIDLAARSAEAMHAALEAHLGESVARPQVARVISL